MELVKHTGDQDLPFYLDYLFDGLTGFVACATKRIKDDGGIDFHRESFEWPLAREVMQDWIIDNSKHCDVYVAPAIFSQPGGRKEHFKATNVLWAEFDGGLPSEDQQGSIPLPGLRIQSSGDENQHWYWRLDSPSTDVSAVESLNRSLTYQLGADVSGWDANQILRPPATHNHKRDKPVFIAVRSDLTVSPLVFDTLPVITQAVVDVQPDVIPDVTDVILKYAWAEKAIAVFKTKPTDVEDRSGLLMQLGYELAEMGLTDNEMFSVLRNADDRWGKFKNRTDRNKRLTELIGVARLKYPSIIDLGDSGVIVYGLQSFLNTEVEIEWVIPGLLQEQGYMLLTGPAGVGKTQFSLRVAINLALGRDFLEHQIAEPRRILFFSLEMGHADLKFFLSTMCAGMSTDDLLILEQNLLIAPLGEAFYLDKSEQQVQFEAILKDFSPAGVFIDSVGSSSSGQVTDESTVKALMDFNDKIRQRHGVFTWFIHHNRKAQGDNKKPNKMADVYGNQYLVNRATSVYCLWPNGDGIEVLPLKKRLSAMEDPWTIVRTPKLDFTRKTTASIKAAPSVGLEGDEPPTTGIASF